VSNTTRGRFSSTCSFELDLRRTACGQDQLQPLLLSEEVLLHLHLPVVCSGY